MSSGEKTEQASQKKREDERKKGNIFQSREVTSSIGLLSAVFILKQLVVPAVRYIESIISSSLNSLSYVSELTVKSASLMVTDIIIKTLLLIVPIGIGAGLIGILLSGIQTRFLVAKERLKPKFNRIDPIQGMKRIFSVRSSVELLKSLVKVTIIASVLYTQIKAKLPEVANLPYLGIKEALTNVGDAVYDITIKIAMYMSFFAVADYIYQWWQYNRDIRMTKQEVKDEYKQTEGDPQLKARIKEVQRKLAQMRMMKKIPEADVVIKNPTHYAVALKYNPPKDRAPIVIAKGKDLVALKIIEIAEKNNVYVTENKPLARGLYEAVDLNRSIPPEFYQQVADILAFIYKLKRKKKGDKR